MRFDLLAVEGVHDVAFVQRLLRVLGFDQRNLLSDVPKEAAYLIPRSFPANKEGNIHRRIDVPSFLTRGSQWVVLHGAGGESNVVDELSNAIQVLDNAGIRPASIAMVLDADGRAPSAQFTTRRNDWIKKTKDSPLLAEYPFPSDLGVIVPKSCPFGVFVVPDNRSPGRLETLLLSQAEGVYPVLHRRSCAFIDEIKTTRDAIPPKAELARNGKNEGKAILHAMTSVLKPGKTLQASIADNDWVPTDPAKFPPQFAPLVTFLQQILGL